MTQRTSRQMGVEPKRNHKPQHPSNAIADNQNNGNNSSSSTTPNRPRNLLITDATQTFHFSFARCGVVSTITIQQTADETTWPGGALWDLGVILSQVLVRLTPNCATKTTTKLIHGPTAKTQSSTIASKTKKKTIAHASSPTSALIPATSAAAVGTGTLPSRLLDALSDWKWSEARVLELGCGVGLTGLVAAALGAKLVVLTDLDVVIEQVAAPNVRANTTGAVPVEQRLPSSLLFSSMHHHAIKSSGSHVIAMPLCWGNAQDETRVRYVLEYFSEHQQSTRPATKPKAAHSSRNGRIAERTASNPLNTSTLPNLILIGDVAYQHKPGAPSHFDALQSTLFQFVDDNTIVLFGTRLRMPASSDLLDLFLEQLEEIVVPPIGAEEIDSIFANQKHNMTIHVLKKKRKPLQMAPELVKE